MPAPVNLSSGCISSSLQNQESEYKGAKESYGYSQLLAVNACAASTGASRIASLDHKILF
jgi:hypothetical protein